jgi:hypothetical protein
MGCLRLAGAGLVLLHDRAQREAVDLREIRRPRQVRQ